MNRWGFTGWALAGSGLVAAALVGLILHLRSETAAAVETLDKAKKDYEYLKRMRQDYRSLEAKKAKLPAAGKKVGAQEYAGFLSSEAKRAGLPAGSLNPPTNPQQAGRWREFPYSFSFSGRGEQAVPRSSFVRFLEAVEAAAPTFKSKALQMRFAPEPNRGDLVDASVTFSHFEQAGGPRK